jgi:hypothetical protein
MKRYLSCSVAAVAALHCGGITDNTNDGGGDGGPSVGCPSTAPARDDACGTEGIECEYGNDVRYVCNTVYTCKLGSWDLTYHGDGDSTCPTSNSSACPATYGEVPQGGACGTTGGYGCNYSTAQQTEWCACTVSGGPPMLDSGAPPYSWMCTFAMTQGCPVVRPTLGAACSQPSVQCDYGVCGSPTGLSVQCDTATSTWKEGLPSFCAGAN